MSSSPRIKDLETLIKQTAHPIFINDLPNTTADEKDNVINMIMTRYTSDMVSLLPSCSCRETKGQFVEPGQICPTCKTPVHSSVEDAIEPNVWFRKPDVIHKLINPTVWTIICNRFKKRGSYDVIRWLCETTYNPPTKQPPVIQQLVNADVPRGYNNFTQNFFDIIEFLLSMKDYRLKKGKVDDFSVFIERYKDVIFTDYIPLPNKILIVSEASSKGKYIDSILIDAVDAIQTLTSIDRDFQDKSVNKVENRIVRALTALSVFYDQYNSKHVNPKPGIVRRHVYGSRLNMTNRNVITSRTGIHKYDELALPWCTMVTMFETHISSKLKRRGYLFNDIERMLLQNTEWYHPTLHEVILELFADAPDQRIPIHWLRNPALLQGSLQQLFATAETFKVDPTTEFQNDRTVGHPILNVRAHNADFDGDEMSGHIACDNELNDRMKTLQPHHSVFGMNTPYDISSTIDFPKTVVSSFGNWLQKE